MNFCRICGRFCQCCPNCNCCPSCCSRHCCGSHPSSTGSFTGLKINSVTGSPVTGAVYTLTQNGQEAASAVSDEQGHLSFSGLVPGEYLLWESTIPDGYAGDNSSYCVNVDDQGNVTINGQPAQNFTFLNTPAVRGALTFSKIDGNTNLGLEGALFTLSNGATAQSNENGTVDFGQVTPGTYTMAETTPPAGYIPNPAVYHIQIDPEGQVTVDGTPLSQFTVPNYRPVVEEPVILQA